MNFKTFFESLNKIEPADAYFNIYYHATDSTYINSIYKNGLICNKKKTFEEDSLSGFIYLATSTKFAKNLLIDYQNELKRQHINKPQIHSMFNNPDYGNDINVLTIDGTKLDKNKLFIDSNTALLQFKSYMYKGNIPPQYILDFGD